MGRIVNGAFGVKRGLGVAQLVPLALSLFLVRYAQGQGPGVALSGVQMKSREADTRIQFEIEEGKPAGTLVGTIPIKPNFVYRFNDQPKEFVLNGTTGEIRTAVEIDRESLRSDRFDLVVLSSQPTYPIEVRVVIVDVNDNAPVFPEPSLNITFSESANVGTRVILDTATDGDAGVNDITTDYKIVSGNDESKFRLVVTTNPSGETPYLHLETTGKVDREDQSHYQLNISGQDGGVPPQYGYLQLNITILDVNDNPPIFDHSDYSVSLNESVPPGTSVLQVRATDDDEGDNAKISYFLSDTEVQFVVDPRTGVISTLEPLSCQQNCPTLDKCPKSCVFTVFARDHGSPRQDGRAYVTVNLVDANDHDPKIRFRFFPTTATHATVDENAQNGSVVAAVSVIDYDEGDNGDTYVEIQGGNELNHFRLETTRSFDIVRVNGILDREQIPKYNLTITAKDKGSPPRSSTSFLIIHVNDVNDHEPVFEKNEYSAILSELVPSGTYVAGITATDEDTGINSNIFYSIVSGNDRRWFNIDLYTGLVTTVANLDRETQDFVELKITARDGGPNPKYTYTYLKIQILDENDEPPLFSQVYINVSLSENAPQNSLVSVVSAVDNDLGTNGSLLYSLHEDVEIRYPNTFHLDPTYGRLTTKTRLDREIIPVYYIKVVARDQGQVPLTSTATVQLNILDVNDNAPVFYPKQYLAKVDPDSKAGLEVLKVSATDKDEGRHAIVSYYIVSGADGKFEIDESTGVIRTRVQLNRSLKSRYELVVAASNPGDREVSQNALVLVFVVDSKQNQIAFGESRGYAFVVEEDPANRDPNVGREVGRVSLTRASSSTGVKYTLADGDYLGWYKIDERSGIITTAKAVDRELESKSVLKVVAYGPSHYAVTRVNITIRDINDCSPEFSRLKERADIYENWPVGHEVFLSTALDKDEGINSLVEYSLGEDTSSSFRIDRKRGMIYLNKPLKLVAGEEYNVEVIAKDSGTPPLSSRQIVTVSVLDVNDHTPLFDHLSYETSLLESTSLNERFFSVLATDADTGPNGKISYKITEGNEDKKFGIFPDGFIYVKSSLDRETRDYYSLTIMAKDNGTKPRMSEVAVVIHVVDENDNSPQFENKTFTFYIAENEAPDTYVGKLTADDQDKGRNAELTYSISTNQNDFVVDPKTGLIRTLKDFDREKLMEISGHDYIVMEAIVLDGGLTRLRDEAKVIVYVTDVNDNSPVFVRTPYRTTISEGAPLRSQVLRVTATDADDGLNGNVLYKITGGNEEGCFEIDDSSGQITLTKTLDRERTQTYELAIQAKDTAESSSPNIARHTSTASVTINVLDENDNNPKFVVAKQETEIFENTQVGYRIFNFSATDADLGSNSDVSYTIAAGNIKETFRIDPTTGVLHLVRPLDYEEQSVFYLNVTAHDGGAPRLTSTIPFTVRVVDVNDNSPLFPNVAIVRQIEEGIPVNTPVVTVTAEDKDSGVNGKVNYRISQQEPPGQHFDIKKDTGVIFTANKIDREFSDSYKLTVVAEDQASPESSRLSADKTVTIIVEDINDNAPTFVSMDTGVIPEGSERARVIMTLSATDNDANTNGMVTYELVEGHGDLFFLDRTSGELYLSRAVEKPSVIYHLTIQATDEAVLSQRKSSRNKITVIGASKKSDGPIFSATEYSGSVFENEAAGTSVLTVRASYPTSLTADSDSRQVSVVEYFLTSVQSNGAPQQRVFAINRQSGVISTSAILDREAGARVYELEVYAVDIGSTTPKTSKCKATITVLDRNDSPPVFSSTLSKFLLSEDAPPGHTVAIVTADDPDIEGRVSYTLVRNGEEKKFALDAENGVLTLHEPLDREMQAQHRIIIKADDEIQSSETTLLVEVTDTNDNPPVFQEYNYSFDIPEDVQRGAQVGAVTATDADVGVNGELSYSVLSDWGNDVFSLNPQTGVFTLTSHLDYEQVQHYIFVVQAQDSGQPFLTSTVTVYFNVLDLNDNAPLFDPMSYNDEILENVTVGASVLQVSVTDLDSGDNGNVIYGIVDGDNDHHFHISSNGTIFTKKALDREVQSFFNLVVSATDQAWPPEKRLTSTVQVTVILKDVNDMAPEFVTPNETSVLENVPPNTVIMAVKAVDRDEGRNSYVEYSLAPQSDNKFTVGPIDGLLRVNGPLDREMKSKYAVTVVAKDRGHPSKMSSVEILVNIMDENDNSPVFDPKQYSGSVSENASIGLSILQVSSTDQDEGLSGQVRYSIIAGDSNHDFAIGEDTGIIRVSKNLDYERKSRYVLTIQAEDGGNDIRLDTATVTISVADVNDNPPTFLDSPYEVRVMENAVATSPVSLLTVTGTDADLLPNNNIHYLIKDGDKSLFRINSSSGEIFLQRSLDREQKSEYALTILAMDSGSPRQTGTGTVIVVVSDVNDNPPVFERAHSTVTVMENQAAGTEVITVTATDADAGRNGLLRYSLEGLEEDLFRVEPDSGTVLTRTVLDREVGSTYTMLLVVRDSGLLTQHSATATLTILVGDENDNQPKFAESRYVVHIPEDALAGHFVLGTQAEDPDAGLNKRLVYHLSGMDADKFQINQDTGIIKLVQKLQEKKDGYHLEIFATDNGDPPLSSSTLVDVFLSSSKAFPTFRPGVRSFSFPESSENVYVTTVSASSPKTDIVRYSIAGGSPSSPFKIDPESGELRIVGGLDHETIPKYELWIEAKDSDNPSLTSAARIDIEIGDSNDNEPIFDREYYNASVGEEQSPPQLVLTVQATDADSNDNGAITYTFISPTNGQNPFKLDSKTGKIQTSAVLDREKVELYQLVVAAVDQGTPPKTGTATIFVTVLDKNDNPPRFTRLFSVNVTENAPVGTFVIQVTSSDRDIETNAKAVYSFTENPGSKFHIDPISGNVTVASWIDREIKDEYLLKVAAVDGSWRAETPLTISVQDLNDNTPEFNTPVHTFNFPELQTAVAFVGRVSASDRDKPGPNSVISYTLKRPSDYFRIDPSSGEVMSKQSLRYRRTSRGFSPENQHVLHVVATDHGKPPLSADTMVVINIVDSNNNAPVFEKEEYVSPVPETSIVGLSVLKLLAEDKEDVGVNAEIEYMVSGGNGTEYFAVNSRTGWVSVTSQLTGHRGRYYAVYVTASDKGIPPKLAEAKVTFVVTGENKHSPVFAALSYQVSIIENEPLYSEIATVSATDSDTGGLNGQVVYSIISGDEAETFAIGPTTGIVTLVKPLDYEKVKEYHLNVSASDRGFHAKKTTAMLTVLVSDVNDNAPLFNSSSFDAYVPENQPIGTYVTRITATDADSKKNAIIQYSLVAGSGRDSFVIESETGVIKAKVKFDYEDTNLYQVEVVAANPGSTQYSATKITIHVTGKNEFYPKFVQQVFQFTVSESSPTGTTVGVLQATDEDSGREGEVFFLLVGSSNDKGFKVNHKTGVMTVSRNLDRESQARVVLTVMAKNYGSIRGNDTGEAQVVISIQDGNDPPVFSKDFYEARVSEAAPPGTHVINVVATDKDVRPNNHQFLYSIMDDSKSVFTIDPNSGSIQTAATLDRETIPYYNITVAAIDGGVPPQTGTAVVMVVLDDVNDNGPIFDPPEVTGYVMENEPPFTSVMVLSATDRDLPPNGAPFMYFLVGGEYKNYFEVDRHSGLVRTMQSLNREATPSIVLTVEVHDSGVPQRKSRHPITIIVMDENDSPSSSRSLTVLVWMYNDIFPGGKVANVHPLDQDVTGQFQCSIVRGDSSVFQIPSKCDLHVYRIKNPRNYTITVKGNDGKHPNVTSTVQVNFATFENETMANSVTLRILNQSAEAFLNNDFDQFQKTLSDIFKSVGFPVLYSITTVNDHIEMTLAIKTTRQIYIQPQEVLSLLQERKHVISKGKNVIIGYDPCDNVPCQNGATCQTYLDFQESLSIIDSSSLVFTSPTVSRQFRCECPGGYSGNLCQYQNDPCSPDPCLNKGACQHDGLDFECVCPPQYEGKRCESQREESCSSSPCKNGGTCEEAPDRSFFCLCRPGFRGTLCEMASDSCRPNRCQNGGTCVSKKPGYECACEANFFGRHCEKSTFGFKMYSYMAFPSLDPSTNDLSITFSTNKRNSLLFYNYGPQAGGRSDFVALELVDGRPKFSFGGSRTAIAIVRGDKIVSDQSWHKVTFIRNGRVASLTVADCSQFGEICEDCAHDNASCSYSIVGHTGSLNFAKNPFFVGGIPSVEALLERPGQIESDDFVGCIHSVSVNGRLLDLKNPAKSIGVTSTCGRKADVCSSPGNSIASSANDIGGVCGESATCKDLWYTYSCTCASGLAAPNCNEALEAFSLDGGNSFLELIPREKYNRIQLGSSSYHRWRRAASENGDLRTKRLSFRFRTKSPNGIILSASTEEILSVIFLRDKKLHFGRGTKSALNNIQVLENTVSISDGEWHTFELRQGQERGSKVNISIDDRLSELAGDGTGSVTDILDPYLTSLTLGGLHEPVLSDNKEISSLQGCFQTITLNGEAQATNWSNSFFDVIPHGSATQRACSDDVLGLGLTQTDPLGIGVILVIVFFAILIVVILVSFIVFRKRKMRRDKPGHLKPGGAFLAGSSDPQRGHTDTGYPDGSPEDILRSHMPQDLVPKKMKDREIERPQRPDIIEREVINKSPITAIPRMEEPPIPEPVKSSSSYGVHGLDSEPPEHYDLENASSIAPSDIDIVYHYKGFRDGNVRKYKANPHLPNFHKHNHRHSPHSFQASPIRESPRNILRQSPNTAVPRESPSVLKMQNTPLARLSPSSELSQQTPRILTLQDISGKPLQTALLATSQGVGPKELRDPMSNSERSLNSPVSNMSHSTSSMRSGPQTVGKKKEAAMSLGLTAEEIERLNSRPRNSSLVSTLDAVSSSSDDNTEKNKLAELLETNTELLEAPDSSTDESGNDSFTCSEFEYDNNYDKVHRDFGPGNMIFSKLAEEDNENDEDSAKNYDGFDSFRGSLSTLVASDDDLSNLSSYKPPNGSMLGWDYLLNWGPNFQNLVGVFKDIAELPDTMSAAASHVKPNEEYV